VKILGKNKLLNLSWFDQKKGELEA